MTLSGWCQDYIFAPTLGTTRNPYIALIASFQVMALWHVLSLNRVVWGLYQAAGLAVHYLWKQRTREWRKAAAESRAWGAIAWLVTQAFVAISFVFVINEESNNILGSVALIPRLLTFGLLQ
jgi:alginate O-acetyltransferase complex protein AlgI